MQTLSQLSSDSEVHVHPGNIPVQDEDRGVVSSTLSNVVLQQPGILFCLWFLYFGFLTLCALVNVLTDGSFLCEMQLKNPPANGLLGHGKRRKVSSMHYAKLARYVIADI